MKERKKHSKARKQETRKLRLSSEPEARNGHPAKAIGVPMGAAAAAVAGRHLDVPSAANTLQHEPTNELASEAANSLTHHATEAIGTEAAAAAAGAGVAVVAGTSASAGAAGAAGAGAGGAAAAAGLAGGAGSVGAGTIAGAGAAGAGAATGAAAAGGGAVAGGGAAAGGAAAAGQGAQAAAVGAVTVAAVATVVVVVANTGDEPEVEEPIPTTTVTTVAPAPEVTTPAPGPGVFETAATGALDGDLLAGVNQDTEAGPLMVAGLQGAPTNVGVPVVLASGATLTVDPQGVFQYVPAESFVELPAGETIVDEFVYVVTNAAGFTEEWTAAITVIGENDAPAIEEVAAVSVVEGSTASRDLVATDPDGDALTFSLADDAPAFVSLTDGGDGTATLAIAPAAGAAGTFTVPITVSDGGDPALTQSTTLSVTVTAKPEEVARVTENLVALYNFGEGSGATVGDSSGAGAAPTMTVADPSAVTWDSGSMTVNSPTIVRSADGASGLSEAIKASNQFTIEAWVTPANATQAGPARVVSISNGTASRNATLAQGETDGVGGDHWSARQRSSETSINGLPNVSAPAGSAVAGRLTHLALVRTESGDVKLYVDGVVAAGGLAGGDLSTWDGSLPLMLANETSMDRPWLGTYHLVAVYARALSEAEVKQNIQVGS